MGIEQTAFSCSSGQFTVRGFEFRPEPGNGVPIVMSHAFLSNQKIIKKYAEALAAAGYTVFTYDFCGGAIRGKSDGKFSDMSIDTEKSDLNAVIAHVAALPYVDSSQLVLLGASQGGFVSCLVAAEHPELVRKLVLLYPALCIPDNARAGQMLMIKFDPTNIAGTIRSGPFHFSPRYPESAIGIDIYAEIQKIQAPILILHGTADKIVPIDYAKKAQAAASNAQLVVIENAGHGFKKKQVQDALHHILPYLNRADA